MRSTPGVALDRLAPELPAPGCPAPSSATAPFDDGDDPSHAHEAHELDLPASITRAIQRVMAWRGGALGQLSLNERALLCELLRCANRLQPARPFYVHRETLCTRLGWSLPTVTRWLHRLRAAGWIRREQDQVAQRARGFQIASSQLSSQALRSLGLLDPAAHLFLRESSVSHPEGVHLESPSESNHARPAAVPGPLDQPAETKPKSPAEGVQSNVQDANGHEAARHMRRPRHLIEIPATLQPLLSRLSATQICALLGRARRAGRCLDDIWAVNSERIRASRNPMAYLISLIALDRDWSWIRAHEGQEGRGGKDAANTGAPAGKPPRGTAHVDDPDAGAQVARQLELLRGQHLTNFERDRVWVAEGSWLKVSWRDGAHWRCGTQMPSASFLRAVKEGRIEQISALAAAEILAQRPTSDRIDRADNRRPQHPAAEAVRKLGLMARDLLHAC